MFQVMCVFFWLPHRSSASAILMWPNVTVMRKYAFPVGKNNIFIQIKTGDPGFTKCLQGSVS